MSSDNPARRYPVTLCAVCAHPGGICNLCDCDEWGEGGATVMWSDLDTEESERHG
jgi:hypothetical protein